MTNVLVIGDSEAVKSAIKEYGAECVWWYAGFEKRREAMSMGLSADNIIPMQSASQSEAEKAMDFDKVIGGEKKAAPAKKKATKKPGEKKDEVAKGDN